MTLIDRLRRALREGDTVRDEDFDQILPLKYRRVSARFWTPVVAARRAANLLVSEGAKRILDVGSGVGKFCLVGAASTSRARFVGLEQRAHLVEIARMAQTELAQQRVAFVHGGLDAVDWGAFDGFYLYNPFAENIFMRASRLDDGAPLSKARYQADVKRARGLLAAARRGTPVVTYCGYGGKMPRSYDFLHSERVCGVELELWIQGDIARDRPQLRHVEDPSGRDVAGPE